MMIIYGHHSRFQVQNCDDRLNFVQINTILEQSPSIYQFLAVSSSTRRRVRQCVHINCERSAFVFLGRHSNRGRQQQVSCERSAFVFLGRHSNRGQQQKVSCERSAFVFPAGTPTGDGSITSIANAVRSYLVHFPATNSSVLKFHPSPGRLSLSTPAAF